MYVQSQMLFSRSEPLAVREVHAGDVAVALLVCKSYQRWYMQAP